MVIVINNLGFTHVINDFNIDTNYLPLYKRRVIDQFIQEWNNGMIMVRNSTTTQSLKLHFGLFRHIKY